MAVTLYGVTGNNNSGYGVIWANNLQTLTNLVNDSVRNGNYIVGGVAAVYNFLEGRTLFYQAVFKSEPNADLSLNYDVIKDTAAEFLAEKFIEKDLESGVVFDNSQLRELLVEFIDYINTPKEYSN